jgi:hypothetical protein
MIKTISMAAAAALLATLVATPTFAKDVKSRHHTMHRGQTVHHTGHMARHDTRYYRNHQARWDRRGPDFWPGDVAAGIVGGTLGAAGAIATAPFRDTYAYDNGYYGNGYYGGYDHRYMQSYAQRNGFVCTPGTLIRAENGETQICQ